MKCCIIRQVAYRFPGTTRIVWANVLCEREGLTLLHVPQLDKKGSHSFVVAQQNGERVFEVVGAHTFGVSTHDMDAIGTKLRALARRVWEMETRRRIIEDDDF
jgi:hypothetical protein